MELETCPMDHSSECTDSQTAENEHGKKKETKHLIRHGMKFKLSHWCVLEVRKLTCRKIHYWIWGAPSSAKTQFKQFLIDRLQAYEYKLNDRFQKDMTENETLILIDQYNSPTKKLFNLNHLCTGDFLFKKGINQPFSKLKRKPYVFVFSDKPIKQMYPFLYKKISNNFIEVNV